MKEENMKKQAVKEQAEAYEEYRSKKMRRCFDCNKPLKCPKINKSGLCTACGLVLASKKRTRKLKKLREKKE